MNLLPIKNTFAYTPIPRPIKWAHQKVEITRSTMQAFCNLAACKELPYLLLGQGIVRMMI